MFYILLVVIDLRPCSTPLEVRMKIKPVIFMTLLLLVLLMARPSLADGGNESEAGDGTLYTLLVTK